MDLVDLLNSNVAALPRIGETDAEAQLGSLFSDYITHYSSMTATDDATRMAMQHRSKSCLLAKAVIETLSAWLDGRPATALKTLQDALSAVGPAVKELVSHPLGAPQIGPLFRLTADHAPTLNKGRLFHMPFEMRDRVAMQRYSLPGLPCLYLGRSAYVCWRECGQPDLDLTWISRFRLADGRTTRVLDLGYSPGTVAAMLASSMPNRSLGVAYAVLWPLVAACSIKRRPGTSCSFVVEYVLPQLLLRWVMETGLTGNWSLRDKVEGIRYFSTRVDADRFGLAAANYVFPAQARALTGVCPVLRERFELTDPVKWHAATGSAPGSYNRDTVLPLHGVDVSYRETEFSRVEGYLAALPCAPT